MPHGISIVIAPLELLQLQLPTKMPQQHISSSLSRHCSPATACDTTLWQPRCLDNICTCFAKLQAHDVPAMPQHQLPLCLCVFPSAHVARCEASSAQAAVPNGNKMEILRGELLFLWLRLRLPLLSPASRHLPLIAGHLQLATDHSPGCHLPLAPQRHRHRLTKAPNKLTMQIAATGDRLCHRHRSTWSRTLGRQLALQPRRK